MVQLLHFAFASSLLVPFVQGALKDGGFYRYFDANEGGAWSSSDKTSVLDPWVKDTQALILAGLTAIQSYTTSLDARRQLMAYYALQPGKGANPEPKDTESGNRIHELLGDTNAWISGNPPALPNGQTQKPIIFNGDGWLEKKGWADPAFDEQGQPIQGKKIQDEYPDQYKKRNAGNKLVPYWAKNFNEYVFDIPYGGSQGTGICSDDHEFAVTSTQIEGTMTMTLCVHNIQRRFPQPLLPKANTIHWDVGRKTATQLDTLSPQALTLLHEYFHVVDYDGTPDVIKAASASTIVSMANDKTKATNVNEAEAYAYFCLASYYNQQKVSVAGKTDVNLVFVSGYAELP